MKRKLILFIVGLLIFLPLVYRVNATSIPLFKDQVIHISIDGNPVDFSIIGQPILLETGRTYVAERFMSKYLAYNGYNENSKVDIWLNDQKTRIEMQLNNPLALVNGEGKYIDYSPDGNPVLESSPHMYQGKKYLPLRFICETFGDQVDYKNIEGVHHIEITTKANSQDLYDKYYGPVEDLPLAGYILIRDNKLYFNEVEIVEWRNQKRVKELGLNQAQMPNGYLIINKNKEIKVYEFAEDAQFVFTDTNRLFVKEEDGNLIYTSPRLEDFLQHRSVNNLGEIPLSGQRIPYFIEIEDGKIKSIIEEFKYTI